MWSTGGMWCLPRGSGFMAAAACGLSGAVSGAVSGVPLLRGASAVVVGRRVPAGVSARGLAAACGLSGAVSGAVSGVPLLRGASAVVVGRRVLPGYRLGFGGGVRPAGKRRPVRRVEAPPLGACPASRNGEHGCPSGGYA